MTVCAAVIAANSKAIMCVADKALTYSDSLGAHTVQWDAGSTKIIPVGKHGTFALVSGDAKYCQELLSRLNLVLNFGKDVRHCIEQAKHQYQEMLEKAIVENVLRPKLLDKVEYLKLLHGNSVNSDFLKNVAEEVDDFTISCSVLLCGFSSKNPFLLKLSYPGQITDSTHTGFDAIGVGWEKAISRLLWMECEKSNSLGEALFNAFDAKANAEMVPGVGYGWDAKVVFAGTSKDVPPEIKDLIERKWDSLNQSPFYEKTKWKPLRLGNWRDELEKFGRIP